MGLLHACARIVAPTIFNLIYMATIRSFPQTVFVVLTVMFGCAFGVSWFVRPGITLEDENDRTSRGQYNTVPEEDMEDSLAI